MSSSGPVLLLSCSLATIGWIISFASLCASGAAAQHLSWWIIVYELIVILLVCATVWTHTIHTYQPIVLALIAISIPYATAQVDTYISTARASFTGVAAGYIVLIITQFSWLVLFGIHQDASLFQSMHNDEHTPYACRPNPSSSMVCMKQQPLFTDSAQASYPPTAISHDVVAPATEDGAVFISPNAEYKIPVLAIHSYEASPEDPNELSFVKGQTLYVHEMKGNWWQAKNSDGTVGMIPSNYVKPVAEE